MISYRFDSDLRHHNSLLFLIIFWVRLNVGCPMACFDFQALFVVVLLAGFSNTVGAARLTSAQRAAIFAYSKVFEGYPVADFPVVFGALGSPRVPSPGVVKPLADEPVADVSASRTLSLPIVVRRSASTGNLQGSLLRGISSAHSPVHLSSSAPDRTGLMPHLALGASAEEFMGERLSGIEQQLAAITELLKKERSTSGSLGGIREPRNSRRLAGGAGSAGSSTSASLTGDSSGDDGEIRDADFLAATTTPPGRRSPVVIPPSPGVVANPGSFLKLWSKEWPSVVIYEDLPSDENPLFLFVGLLSAAEQETTLVDGRSQRIKMVLQIVSALHPAADNNMVSWANLGRDIDGKAKIVLSLFTYYATEVMRIFPLGVSERLWDNSGTEYQTVFWPHLNAAWSKFSEGLTLDRVKGLLGVPEFKETFKGFCDFSFRYLREHGDQKAEALWLAYQAQSLV